VGILSWARLEPPEHRLADISPGVIVDLLWLAVVPADHVEHITVVTTDRHVRVAALVSPRNPLNGDDLLIGICRRAISASPPLAGWSAGRLTP
jgi:hypothetical protein